SSNYAILTYYIRGCLRLVSNNPREQVIKLETATLQVPHYFTLRYLSIALRMYVLRGISPRLLSIFCNKDIGKVIPSFSVLSGFFLIVLTILVDYI
ncbi:MAG: hypothetical protein ACJ72Q_21170, partial [Nitrososphaeraceae archaeon]